MPENPNPYMDPNMNPSGFMPNYGQPGYTDETNPYAQQGGWDQSQYGMPAQGYPGAPQADMFVEDYLNPGNMASPQDIYANQVAQMGGMPGQYGAPYPDPNAAFMDPGYGAMGGQPYVDPYAQEVPPQGYPYGQQPGQPGAQPYYDPMQQGQMPGQPGQPEPSQQQGIPYGAPGQTGQQPSVSPSQTGGFENPMQVSQQGVAEPQVPGGMPQPADAAAAQAAAMGMQPQAQQPLQQVPISQQQAQAQQQAQTQAQPPQQSQQQAQAQQPQRSKGKKGKKGAAQAQAPAQVQPQQAKPMAAPAARRVDPSKATKGRATLALILSILSIILALVPPVGLALSIVARKIAKSYRKNGGRAGSGEAAAVFSLVGIIFSIVTCALLVWFIGYVCGALIGSKAYMNPIAFFNNSPLGMLFKIPT